MICYISILPLDMTGGGQQVLTTAATAAEKGQPTKCMAKVELALQIPVSRFSNRKVLAGVDEVKADAAHAIKESKKL